MADEPDPINIVLLEWPTTVNLTDRVVRYPSGLWYWRVCGTEGGRERVILHVGSAIGFYLSVRWRDGRKRLHLFKGRR